MTIPKSPVSVFSGIHDYADAIVKARSERISALLDMCYKLLDLYESGTLVCTRAQSTRECDSLVYGCLIKGLQRLELLPRRVKASEIDSSVTVFAGDLRSLECFTYPEPYRNRQVDYSHLVCGFRDAFADQISAILGQEEPSGVLEEHLTHINEQKK